MEKLTLAGIELELHSVGGIETMIHLPRMKIAFDIGRCPPEVVGRQLVFFTHGHMDHMGGVAYHTATRALRGMEPPTYVVPPHYVENLAALMATWRKIDRSDMPHTVVPLDVDEDYVLHDGLFVRSFRSYHTAPCQGYAVISRRRKLAPEYADRPGDELRRLRVDEGIDVTRPVDVVEFAYCGDTTIEVIEREALARQARVLALEVTFVGDQVSRASARERGHVHLEEVAERADLFENEVLLLHHFSPRFGPEEILRELDRRLPAGLRKRVVPLLGGHG